MLDAVAENCARLSDANNAEIFRLEDNLLRLVASYGDIPLVISAHQGILVDRDTVAGRAACDRRTIQVRDLAAEEREYPVGSSNAKLGGHRTTLATPLLREGVLIGIILLRRREVLPFSGQQIALIETFANQAVIAIENARLFEAERQRTLSLARLNRELAGREAKIRRLVDSNIIGIFIWDFDGGVLEANDEFLRIVNHDREDLLSGRIRWTDLTPPDWSERDSAKIEQQKVSGRLEPFEKEYTRKDGRRVPVLIGVATFEVGGNEGVAFVLDLTERKRAEQALMRSEAYLAEAQKLTHTGSWAWNPRTEEVLYCSKEMFQIFGLDPQKSAPSRENFRQQIHPEDRDRIKKKFEEALREKVDTFAEYRVLLPNGTVRNINASGHLVLNEDGELIEFVGTATDVTERKRAEDALRESEYNLRRIVETVPSMLWSTGPDGEPSRINQRILDYSGLTLEKFLNLGWEEFLHPEDFPETARAFFHAIQTGEPYEAVHRLRRSDGQYRWHDARGEPLRDREGKIVQWYGLSVDIDERKRSEERVRVQHTVAHILAEAATIEKAAPGILRAIGECLEWDVGALWRVDREAEALRCVELWHKASIEVPEFERVSRESTFVRGLGLPGRVWSSLKPEYVPDVVPDVNFPRVSIAEREGLHAAIGFPILLGSEVLGVIECFSREIRQPDQELLNMLATIGSQIGQFIERKRAEDALHESERSLRSAIDGIAGLVVVLAPNGELEAVNRQCLEYFGRSLEWVKNWGTNDAVHPEDLPRVAEIFSRAMATTLPYQVEARLRGFDGEHRWFEARGVPVRDGSGRIARWYVLLTDIDDRTRALARLEQVQSDFAHVNRVSMMGELAASLSHEITQPIGSARNNARAAMNFLDKNPPDLREVREALGCVVGDTDRAGDIIDRIRDHIKKAPPRKRQFDLNEAIDEVILLGRSAIIKNGVSVRTRLSEGLFPIHCDRVQLQQVVLNLVLNAAEAMGSVEAESRNLLISTEQRDTGVLVAVCDSGPGIDPAHSERVFEAFYTTKPRGVGMGLSICRSIIDAHGGRLWAEANKPRGTIFQFTLPAVRAGS